ncbi:MAG: hypothetical protein HOP15_04400 [Planctomycetes bacterium]|nr:hypothetical protein [Planctomycetota bacterium]
MDHRTFTAAKCAIAFVRFNAWLLLVLGTLTLGYALFAEFTGHLLRGGAFELGLGIFGLAWTSSRRRKLASSST